MHWVGFEMELLIPWLNSYLLRQTIVYDLGNIVIKLQVNILPSCANKIQEIGLRNFTPHPWITKKDVSFHAQTCKKNTHKKWIIKKIMSKYRQRKKLNIRMIILICLQSHLEWISLLLLWLVLKNWIMWWMCRSGEKISIPACFWF